MGEKNGTICSYMSKAEIFADFINGSLYAGERVIAADELEPQSFTGKEEHEDRKGKRTDRLRIRDVVKVRKKGDQLAVIAVENQEELNFLMPFRVMEYDVEDYARQIRRMIRQHRQDGDLRGDAEFLSGVKETERLNPVVTVVFYHGKSEWDTCRELHDMINFNKENEKLKKYTPNYIPNIVPLQELKEEHFQTGLRELIGMMQRRDDKVKMREYLREHQERFRQMDDDTYDVISVMVDRRNLEHCKKNNRNEEGSLDMCKAFDEIEEEARQEGREEGRKKGHAEGRLEGENRLALLITRLLEDNRLKEMRLAISDEAKREALYREYSIA